MFSKRQLHTFMYYYHVHDAARWEEDFRELCENGVQYIIISEGFDLKSILASEDQKNQLIAFLDAAHAQDLKCILNPGNPRDLYLLPDAKRWRIDYLRHVADMLGDHPAVYALLLEDSPTGGSQFAVERWKTVTTELEGRLEGRDLTTDGYQYMIKCWQMDQYAEYIDELTTVVKKAKSRLKTTISFHVDALFPYNTLVQFQSATRSLDFVIIDAGTGWHGDPNEGRYLTRFLTNVATGLVEKEKDIWVVIGSHVEHNRYQSTLHEVREWTQQALDMGASGIGWRGWDASQWTDRYPIRGISIAESKPKHWSTILSLSRMIHEKEPQELDATSKKFLISHDSLINQVSASDYFIPNMVLGEESRLPLSYISDTSVIDKKGLQKQKFLFTTPCPSIRKEIVEPLMKFMKAGGWIIASADDCLLDEQMRPTDARSVLFGIQEESSLVFDSQILLDVNLPELPGGASLASAWHRIALTEIDDGVHVIGHWGDQTPAIILKLHGKGGALYIGTNPYRAALVPGNHQEWPRFFRSVVESPILNDLTS